MAQEKTRINKKGPSNDLIQIKNLKKVQIFTLHALN